MAKDIEYQTISGINMVATLSASERGAKAEKALGQNNSTVWNQVVSTIMESVDLNGIQRDTSKEGIEKIRLVVCKIVQDRILSECTIPEKGKDRKGKDMDVSKDDGSVKWSSWSATFRLMAYCGEIAKVIAFQQEGVLYPEQYKVAPKSAVMALCKVVATPIENITRLTKDIQQYADVVTGGDAQQAHDLIESVKVADVEPVNEALGLINRLNGVLSGLEDNQKEPVRQALMAMISTKLQVATA